jgi:hypothetical protein
MACTAAAQARPETNNVKKPSSAFDCGLGVPAWPIRQPGRVDAAGADFLKIRPGCGKTAPGRER